MSATGLGVTFAFFVAVALLVFKTLESFVLEHGAQQLGKLISWSLDEQVTESTSQSGCLAFDCEQRSSQHVISLLEREVVWSEQSSYVLHYLSPLCDHFILFGFSPLGLVIVCCRISVSRQQRDSPSSIPFRRVSDGGLGSGYKNPRLVLQRGRGTLA